jgi:AcrR family transcriptional regulator
MRKNSKLKYDKILHTTIALFNEQGINISGVDLISARSGVAKMTLYKYFESKNGLIKTYLDFIAKQTLDRFNDLCASRETQECINNLFALAIEKSKIENNRACPLICAALELGNDSPEFLKIVRDTYEDIRHSIDMKLYDFQHPSAESTSKLIISIYEGAVVSSFINQSSEPLELAKQQALAFLK